MNDVLEAHGLDQNFRTNATFILPVSQQLSSQLPFRNPCVGVAFHLPCFLCFAGEIRLIRVAVILGSGIPLLLYIAWDAVALGLLPTASLSITERQVDPVDVLIDAQGAHMGLVLTLFAFTAVATTILG